MGDGVMAGHQSRADTDLSDPYRSATCQASTKSSTYLYFYVVVVVVLLPGGLWPPVSQWLQMAPEVAGQGRNDVAVPQLRRCNKCSISMFYFYFYVAYCISTKDHTRTRSQHPLYLYPVSCENEKKT